MLLVLLGSWDDVDQRKDESAPLPPRSQNSLSDALDCK